MPRIERLPARRAGLLTKLAYRYARRRFGAVPDPMAVLAHHRGLLLASCTAELAVDRAARALPASLRELAVFRTATRIGCSWCVDFGTMLQRDEGLDVARLREIDEYRASSRFSELDGLVIEYADAMTELPVRVTDAQVAELDRRLGHRGLLELTYLIALENQRTRLNHALDLTAQGFTSGEACWAPMP